MASNTSTITITPNTKATPSWKKDQMLEIEKELQQEWRTKRLFEANAPSSPHHSKQPKKMKFFGTFPYPYMNGRLHLGHVFTLSKVEFACAYQRMKGNEVLFPFAFHCTGMPIKACADKLARELELYGNPPHREVASSSMTPTEDEGAKASADPLQFHSKKSKASAKKAAGGGEVLQYDILRSMNIPEEQIAAFGDHNTWLNYFPPLTKADLEKMGCHIDWRRSFITTDRNPFYDSFVRWQFNSLRAQGKVTFGKRYTVYSAKDGQPCADHDRAVGEGVLPQEYTLIKIKVERPYPPCLASLEARTNTNVYLAAATLRPETMYGQTNCWVSPTGVYGAFEVPTRPVTRETSSGMTGTEHIPVDILICTERAARNLAFQGYSPKPEQVSCVIPKIEGKDLIGLRLCAPRSPHAIVYALPMLTISDTKGTGIVTSVPSDSPDDFAALRDLQTKPALRAKYGVLDEWVLPFQPIPIIHITPPAATAAGSSLSAEAPLSKLAAVHFVNVMDIKSQHDREKLDAAKEEVYKLGFYHGTMRLAGTPWDGMKVAEAKPKVRDDLIGRGEALPYCEPAERVISRSGDECVVSLTDQWFLNYADEAWKAEALRCLRGDPTNGIPPLRTFGEELRHMFEATFPPLNQWACSRSYGLGTRLPWDEQYLIESLSDSTIYPAFYTVAHLLLGENNFDGSRPGPLGIRPEQLTNEVWDYIFARRPADALPVTDLPEDSLRRLRGEFDYWYGVDLRVSGKDLVPNHLTFYLLNHVAMWSGTDHAEQRWPRGIRVNGHVLLNAAKMSKSTGNFLTLTDAIDKFSADGMRIALAEAGDGIDDANFSEDVANKAVLRLHSQIEWCKEIMHKLSSPAPATPTARSAQDVFFDQVFQAQLERTLQECDRFYEAMLFREALKAGFFDLQQARDDYRLAVGGDDHMRADLVRRFVEVQAIVLAPIAPHFAEYLWTRLLGHPSSIMRVEWPAVVESAEAKKHRELLLAQFQYLQEIMRDFRQTVLKRKKAKQASPAECEATIVYCRRYPEWQQKVVEVLRGAYDEHKNCIPAVSQLAGLLKEATKEKITEAMQFASLLRQEFETQGREALSLELPFDERKFLESMIGYIHRALSHGGEGVKLKAPPQVVEWVEESEGAANGGTKGKKLKQVRPGKPQLVLSMY